MPELDPPPLPAWLADAFPFARRAYQLEDGPDRGKRIHFADHGDPGGRPILLLHGNPTWSFLWRKVIQLLDPTQFRCLAPDLLGFGLSSKLWRVQHHTLDRHLAALGEWIRFVAPGPGLILVGQDWGGPLVLGTGAHVTEHVSGIVLGNTSVLVPRRPRGTTFHRFAHLPLVSDLTFRFGGFPQRGGLAFAQGDKRSIRGLTARAYRWPLRGVHRRAGPLGLARMVPNAEDHESLPTLTEIERWLRAFDGPLRFVWGEADPILGRALARHEREFPRAHVTRTSAGHFLQEEVPEQLAAAIQAVAAETAVGA